MTKGNRVGQIRAMAWALVAAAMAVPATAATVTYTWTASAAGNWSDAANWSSATLPVSSLTDTILEFKPNTTADWLSPALNNTFQTGGTFEAYQLVLDHAGSTKKRYALTNASGNTTTLSVGAGGISDKSTNYVNIEMNMNAAASQSWDVVSGGSLYVTKNVTSDAGVVVTKTGAGTLYFQNVASSGFNGSFAQSGGTIILAGTNQFTRLGSSLAVSGSGGLGLQANNNATSDFNTSISFGSFSGMYQIHYNSASNAIVNLKGALSGNLTGSSYLGVLIGGGNTIRFQADSSSLTSTANAASGQYAIRQRSGTLVVDHANALGTGNAVSVALGEYNGSTSGSIVSLLTNGYDLSAPIIVSGNDFVNNPDKAAMGMAVVGLGQGFSSATFSGNVYLQKKSPGYAANELRLTAPTGGTVTFSGVIQDQGYADQFEISPVTVYGTGTVKVSGNNTYKGTTAVRSGTLLLAHDSAMGTATTNVLLGDAVSGRKTVKAATTANPSGTFTSATNTWSFSTAATFDGVTSFALDDLILVKDSSVYAYNGVYKVTAVDGTGKVTAMVRDSSMDTYDEAVYGYTVNVASGTANGGKRFATTRLNTMSATTFNTAANNLNGEIVFIADQVDPTVAMLTDGARTIARNITVTDNFSTGKSILGGNTAHVSQFTGMVTLSKDLTTTAVANGQVIFTGDITGSFGITKEGAGKVSFDGNKSYTGVTAVTAGTLEVNGTLATSQMNVQSGSTLTGSFTLSNGAIVSTGGTLSPGNSPGTMTIAGLTLDAASNLNYDLAANDLTIGAGVNDLININGNLTLAGTLNVAVYGGTELSFGTYRLMNYTGTLTNNTLQLAGGLSATRAYQIDTNTAGQVNLVVSAIPEPASLGLLALGSILIAGRPRTPRPRKLTK